MSSGLTHLESWAHVASSADRSTGSVVIEMMAGKLGVSDKQKSVSVSSLNAISS